MRKLIGEADDGTQAKVCPVCTLAYPASFTASLQAACLLCSARAIASWENEGLSTITTKKSEMRKGQQREEFGQNAVSRFWLASHLPDKSRKEKKDQACDL